MPTAAAPANANLTPPEFAWEEESPVGGIDEAGPLVSKNVSAPFDIDSVMRQVRAANNSPVIGPEFGMDEPVYGLPALRYQSTPSLAFDGENYLVVWADNRGGGDVYGARIASDGTVLDPSGIRIAIGRHTCLLPVVIFGDKNYFVVWEHVADYDNHNIYGTRVSKEGIVLDPNGIAISTAEQSQEENPAIAFDGNNYFVVWQDSRNEVNYTVDYDIYGSRVSEEGIVLDPDGIAISVATNRQEEPSIAFDGTNYLVLWNDLQSGGFSDLYGARIAPTGEVLAPNRIAISEAAKSQRFSSIAFDGNNYFAVWQDGRNGSYSDLYGARISPLGTVLDPDGIAISIAQGNQQTPAIAFDGRNFFVVWRDSRNEWSTSDVDRDIYGARVTQEGVVLDTEGIAIATDGPYHYDPVIAFDGTNYLIAWTDGRNGPLFNSDIYGVQIADTGELLDSDGLLISAAANHQISPSVAFDGSNYLIVWQDYRNDSYDIYGSRVTSTGAVLDPNGILISATINDETTPDVAFDGTNYLVVWQDGRNASRNDVYGARITSAGTVLDPSGIAISIASNSQEFPSIAFDGTNYLVVWVNYRSDIGCYIGVDGARISPAGVVLDSNGIAISSARIGSESPAIVFGGENYFVAWQNSTDMPSMSGAISGSRINPSGEVLDPNGIAIGAGEWPSIAFDGANYLVVWSAQKNLAPRNIYGAMISSEGVILNTEDIAISPSQNVQQMNPFVVFDGVNYLIVWDDTRNNNLDIYGMRMTKDGTFIGTELVLSSDEYSEEYPAVASSGDGRALIVYQHFDDRSEYYTTRVVGRLFPTMGEQGNTCETDSQCTNNQCVDGVCCVVSSCDDGNFCTVDSCAVSGDGTCTNVAGNLGRTCRTSAGDCDMAETCNGSSASCPAEDYTAVNGDTCDDINALTENDTCSNGICAGELISGVCGNTIAIDTLPYTATGTTVGRPNALNAYGAACGNAGKPSPDIIYALTVETSVEYLIEVAPEASYDVTINLIGACQNNEMCLGVANGGGEGDAEAIIYSSASPRTIYIALEGTAKNEVGSYEIRVTTVEEPDDTPPTDADTVDDTVVEPDDEYITSEADSVELTDDAMTDDIQFDEAIVDDAVILDEDTWVYEGPGPGEDDIAYPEYDHTVTDDGTLTDTDTFQPDETVDEPVDSTVEDTDSIIPDEPAPVDADTAKPNGDGCGCTVVF